MKRFLFFSLLAIIGFNCQKDVSTTNNPTTPNGLPVITTTIVTSITSSAAAGGGVISSDGGSPVIIRGVCWSTAHNPTVADPYVSSGTGTGTFTCNLNNLTAVTTYYVRAFAKNGVGLVYGNEVSFITTNLPIALPTVTTDVITSITTIDALGGGNASADGGATITARGICWSTTTAPTTSNSHTINGNGTGIFTSNIAGLTPATTYHVRAYATNSVGTAYGNEVIFATVAAITVPTITTTTVTAINSMSASSGGNISSDGGSAVTARGVCWATSSNPLASGNHTTDGTGPGIFSSSLTGLSPTTTYYVRAYASNSIGTAYGNELTFTTATPEVFIAGLQWNATTAVATIWDNGVAVPLTNGVNESRLLSVFVSGPDVYATGYEKNGSNYDIKVWKNGVPTTLATNPTGNLSFGESVFVSGTDVYVCGERNLGNYFPSYWKNGVKTDLTTNVGGDACSIFVSGSDIYIAGSNTLLGGASGSNACIWKNGAITNLTTSGNYASAHCIYVSGNDVYACGSEKVAGKDVAKIWKNGIASNLTNGTMDAYAYSVFVTATDVYACGYEYDGTKYYPRLWKNGTSVPLQNGSNSSEAASVYVLGSDVYVAGRENTGPTITVKLWKNGVVTSITNGATIAFPSSIFVR